MKNRYSNPQLWMLVVLRVAIGWHLLYEGIVKLMNPNWSSVGYLMDSKGWFAGMFQDIASNPGLLQVADFLNIWGLILIGLGLLLGLFTRVATVSGIVLLGLYYLSHPALINVTYAIPTDGSYIFVNKNLVEMLALGVLLVFPTGHIIGIDRLLFRNGAAS